MPEYMNIYDLNPLFSDVQTAGIFSDGKTFVDCIPKRSPENILADYFTKKDNPSASFSLKQFIDENFDVPPAQTENNYVTQKNDIIGHIKNLWNYLRRQHDAAIEWSSLLPLPFPYIVPGGRFREVYYWDSYFTMIGLKESGETEMIKNMIDNFAYLITAYGHIPNGNRSYYLSRSQPPFFTLMVELYASVAGHSVFDNYAGAIEKEYSYWMDGYTGMGNKAAYKKLVSLPDGSLLNRYFDEGHTPRPESWADDVETAGRSTRQKECVYNHLRSAAESGWDFSSRWLADEQDLSTIETADIIPVDLNALLYHTEISLASHYRQNGHSEKYSFYHQRAVNRFTAIQQYCLNKETHIYYDYHWKQQQHTGKFTPASFFPLWLLSLSPEEAKCYGKAAAEKLRAELLREGGVLTTTITNGQQWDAPNGWAPLQWVVIQALENSGQEELAADIAKRWIKLTKDVFERTGKMMEKYNVTDTHLEAGGGEYPGQDGFGWSNGVFLSLIAKYGDRS